MTVQRATLNIPDELLSEVQRFSGQKTKTRAIVTAMEEFIRKKKLEKLLALKGKVGIEYNRVEEEKIEIEAQAGRGLMKNKGVIPDTCAWTEYFRNTNSRLKTSLEHLLLNGNIFTCGPIMYELSQGIKSAKEKNTVLDAMRSLTYIEMSESLWIKAGELSTSLRRE